MIPALFLLTLPIGAALYFVDMPKLGKPHITGHGAETEHDMDLRPLNPGWAKNHPSKRRVYLTPSTKPSS